MGRPTGASGETELPTALARAQETPLIECVACGSRFEVSGAVPGSTVRCAWCDTAVVVDERRAVPSRRASPRENLQDRALRFPRAASRRVAIALGLLLAVLAAAVVFLWTPGSKSGVEECPVCGQTLRNAR